MTTARLLIVAGVDSSGGAGLDADRDALRDVPEHARGALAVSEVVTAWTRQTDEAVLALGAVEPARWRDEALAVGEVDALKLGLLPGAAAVRAAAELVRARPGAAVVVDPVLRSSSGAEFLDAEGRAALLDELVPAGVVLTPNLPEAAALAGVPLAALLEDLDARVAVAASLLDRGARAVLLKAGHGAEDPVQDLCLERGRPPVWSAHPRRPAARLRGTGCRYATLVAAHLALGRPLAEAAAHASRGLARRFSTL